MRGKPFVIGCTGEKIGAAQYDTGRLEQRQEPLVVIAQDRALLQADKEAMAEGRWPAAEIESEKHAIIRFCQSCEAQPCAEAGWRPREDCRNPYISIPFTG